MKKIILAMFLMFGVMGFARYIEECRVVSHGRGYMNCVSVQTGRRFNFTRGYISGFDRGSVYYIEFQGNGYSGLRLTGSDYLY